MIDEVLTMKPGHTAITGLLFFAGWFGHPAVNGQSVIVDHDDVALFDHIPAEFKDAAADMRLLFMDRSVGANIHSFLDCLSNPFEQAPNFCTRTAHQDPAYNADPSDVQWPGSWDRSNWHYAFWPSGCSEDVTCFIDYAEERMDSFDVLGCQFSYLAVTEGSGISDPVTGFFGAEGNDNKATTYAQFSADHPDKKVIWWTTSLARAIGTQESESFNEQMRTYAAAHDIILFDVADILAHTPDGEPCFDNRDGVMYKDENHPDDGLDVPAICPHYTTETEGGHLGSVAAGGIRVVKGLWVLMARLAGWDGMITSTATVSLPSFNIAPNPASGTLLLSVPSDFIEAEVSIVIYNMLGTCIYRVDTELLQPGYLIDLDAHHVRGGTYLIQVKTGQATWCQTFLRL